MIKQLISFLIFLSIFSNLRGSAAQADTKPVVEIVSPTISSEAQNSFEMLPKGKTKALIFISTWCPSCRLLKPVLEKLKVNLQNVQFIEYDIDSNMDILEKYDIGSFPRILIIDKNNKFIESIRINQNEKLKESMGYTVSDIPFDENVYKEMKSYIEHLDKSSSHSE